MSVSTVLSTTATVLYYACFPIILLVRLLLAALVFIAAPIVHVAHYVIHALLWPVHQLGKLEVRLAWSSYPKIPVNDLQTLYVYFGVAALVGILTGVILHYLINSIIRGLGIDRIAEQRGRTLSSYRAEKLKRQTIRTNQTMPSVGLRSTRLDPSLKEEYPDWLKQDKGSTTKGLLSTTILEEEDSSEAGI